MTDAERELRRLLQEPEGERLEFKEAKSSYSAEKLHRYAVALANEGGGKFILGVSDQRPRHIVGTKAFPNLEEVKRKLIEQLRLRVEVEELHPPEGRVLIFEIPARPIGMPLHYKGEYLMRGGESTVQMTQDALRAAFNEIGPDYSSEILPRATLGDLDPRAIEVFRARWIRKSGNENLRSRTDRQLLEDAELIYDGGVTVAALVLLGTQHAIGRYLGQAEVVFEYRNRESAIKAQQRLNFRDAFFLIDDSIWEAINARNDVQQFQEGLFMRDVPTFNEQATREALLNAVSHRDYRLAGSVFIRQYPRRMEITSPGGFPAGITAQNILRKQAPRNRRIAEAFARCGLVERSGQGVDRMFETAILEAKPKPDFSRSDEHEVVLILRGNVMSREFLRLMDEIGDQTLNKLTVEHLIVLDLIYKGEQVDPKQRELAHELKELGIVEPARRNRFVIAHRFYEMLGKSAEYTRKKGLDREAEKALLVQHLNTHWEEGCPLRELEEVLPHRSTSEVQWLLRSLKKEGRVYVEGHAKGARWYASASL